MTRLTVTVGCPQCDDGEHTFLISGERRPARGFDPPEMPDVEWQSSTCGHTEAAFSDAYEAAIGAAGEEEE